MSENLEKLINTSYKLIEVAKGMLQSCQLKKNKVYSDSRFIISFFFRRAWEMFESFLILIKEKRIVDSAVLLRSFCDMGVNLGYIFSDKLDKKEKEIRAMEYMLEGDRAQLSIMNANIEEFKEFDSKIELRRDELKEEIRRIEEVLKNKYSKDDWKLPSIKERAKESGFEILKNVYNQSYKYFSNIEHHSIFFGQDYVDKESCEPKESTEKFEKLPHMKPTVNLYLFRIIFKEILGAFNDEFQLNWGKKLSEIRKIQEEEYKLLKE
jgi:predicted AlkP superfamily phosphohydrolase/phosphomutase